MRAGNALVCGACVLLRAGAVCRLGNVSAVVVDVGLIDTLLADQVACQCQAD
jgi:hypothetical protein